MGFFRFSLIIAVVYYHLAQKVLAGPIAVYGFFVLSGFVITLVSAEIYNGGLKSKAYFLANRVARVWPTYLACLGISLACMVATDYTTGFYQREYLWPSSLESWLVQFTILGQSDFSGSKYPERVLLPAWSLSTEIAYYLVIGLITGSSRWLTTIGFALSILLAGYALANDYPYAFFYFSIQGPSVAFFIGAMFYHWRHLFTKVTIRKEWLLILLTNLVIYVPDFVGLQRKEIVVLYVTTFYLGYITMCLYAIQDSKPTRFEQFLADVTYPMFLLHWAMGAIVCYYWFYGYQRNMDVFLLAFPLTLVVSAAIVYGIEMPNKKLRRYFRNRAKTA